MQNQEIIWTKLLDSEIAKRHWALQRHDAAACDLGASPASLGIRNVRPDPPHMLRSELFESSTHAWIASTIATYIPLKDWWMAFWSLSPIEFFLLFRCRKYLSLSHIAELNRQCS